MKNKSIEKDVINKITEHDSVPIREKAFFTIMRQSGLAPHIIKQLKIKNAENILELNTPIPCKITIPQQKYPTFIGNEAIHYLKLYLITREDKLSDENLLFTAHNDSSKEINTKDVSRTFRLAAQKLKNERKIAYEPPTRGKPSKIRLYKLKEFYNENTEVYQKELNSSNTPKDDEFKRKLYEEKAMPLLEIEPLTNQMHQLKKRQEELERRFKKIEDEYPEDEYGKWLEEHPEEAKQIKEQCKEDMKKHEKWRKEHPDEAKKEDEEFEEYQKYCEEHDKELRLEYLEDKVKEWESRFKELENILRHPKGNE